ncbi:MAG: YqzE family protein [Paenibacillus sp.]|uniref:YqzE family protein n=1 Tax=Paenibacillus aquistagni TaxID=1852522 RepID=UPI00145B1674|nr:YqzE family protein [Paenibacillus aquistagni]MBR2570414.1 YqzE family protein [Paenibacillus sp.]NMM54998.1 YqzE family protein [Paenibacillus aquistagni]
MAKSDDLIKYITQRVVTYMDMPKETRQERKKEHKARHREPFLVRWFGLMPFGMKMWASDMGKTTKPIVNRVARFTGKISKVKWRKSAT